MTKLEEIAKKARAGEELTEEELEYVAEMVLKLGDLLEQTIEWLRPVILQVVAIWLDTVKKIEKEHQ